MPNNVYWNKPNYHVCRKISWRNLMSSPVLLQSDWSNDAQTWCNFLLRFSDNINVTCIAQDAFQLTSSIKIEIDSERKARTWMTLLKWWRIKGKWRLMVSSIFFYHISYNVFMAAPSFSENHWFTQRWITEEPNWMQGGSSMSWTTPRAQWPSHYLDPCSQQSVHCHNFWVELFFRTRQNGHCFPL